MDFTNAIFEFAGAFFIGLHILKVWSDKMVRGVSWPAVAFFSLWGFWNLFYYPSLDQWWSFVASCCIVTMNSAYVISLLYWTRHENTDLRY